MKRPLLSLKGQALALLSRREHSRAELRGKLLAHARKRALAETEAAQARAARGSDDFALAFLLPADAPARHSLPLAHAPPELLGTTDEGSAEGEAGVAVEVEAVLDWLESQKYLSDSRFVESRVNARAGRHGQARIQLELSRLGVVMDADTAQQLRSTEFERAREVWRRKFGELATEPAAKAKQARFLAARGFAAEVVWRIVGGRGED